MDRSRGRLSCPFAGPNQPLYTAAVLQRRALLFVVAGALLVSASAVAAPSEPAVFPWLAAPHTGDLLEGRFAPPEGFARVPVAAGSFGAFLRRLPLRPTDEPVRAFDGRALATPHVAVVALDVGARDLQQCADSALRLRAEHLWARGEQRRAAFHATSGDLLPFARYAGGEQIAVTGNKVRWRAADRGAAVGEDNRAALSRWLDDVFMYAGSMSLAKDTAAVTGEVAPGDLFVQGGSPGHVLVVLDVAARGAERRLLIGEGFMPAQSFHVVPAPEGGAWITPAPDGSLKVPTWPAPFPRSSLRRFAEP
ncbi:MAG: hypothetical protein IT383_14340 [Deltaproteobacteria bacterium]|nr:hypothetical protein [Deltaproteobacteria bacterium]